LPQLRTNLRDIARSLILLMLILLAVDLPIKSYAPNAAGYWLRMRDKIIALAMFILWAVGLGLTFSTG